MFLLPELRDDPESDKRVMQVLSQTFARHCELDPWIPRYRVNGPVAAHENLQDLSQARAIPFPYASRKALVSRKLAHQPYLAQPASQRIRGSPLSGRVVGDVVTPDPKSRIAISDQGVEVRKYFRVCVSESRGRAGETAFCDEICEQADLAQRHGMVSTEARQHSRDCDSSANLDIVQGLPTFDRQERMVAGDLNHAASSRPDSEAGFDTTVDPRMDFTLLDRPIPGKTEDGRHSTLDSFLNG